MTGDVFLTTARLTLHRFTEPDAELLVELDSDQEVMRYVGPFRLGSAEAYRERIRTMYAAYYAGHPARGVWAVEETATAAFLGWVALRPAVDYKYATEVGWTRPTDLELGYRLRRSAWGKGYATEMSRRLVDLAMADPTVTGVVSCALVTNVASWRVMEKCGLRKVGEFAVPGFADSSVSYARCRPGCEPLVPPG
jgi:RimJ/RimL family protein N-acetyltransferase